MKETEKVPFDSMPPLIRGSFLTKEQAEKLKEPFKDVVSVVRCKDCKHRPEYPDAFGADIDGQWCYWCEHLKAWEPDNWFCADGERK